MLDIPVCRWGIVATGFISAWFVADLVVQRDDAKVHHIIQAIGSSSAQKGRDFAKKHCPHQKPTIYSSYQEVYADPDVECVYIGTPHSFHKQNCLDAIAADKNILCEKPFTINAKEAKEVFRAAKEKGVYVAEAMWLRHRPLVTELRKTLFKEQAIGEISYFSAQYALPVDIASLPSTSRYRDLALGAGSLLDVGIYPLTWALLSLDAAVPENPEEPNIVAAQTHSLGIEVTTSAILHYPSTGRHANISSTFTVTPTTDFVCRIQGSKGYIDVTGKDASHPAAFTVFQEAGPGQFDAKEHEHNHPGQGFTFEADNTALDILAHRKESAIMPWRETIRVMEIMDEIRKQGGTCYPQDENE
ncbi:hypothetical protein ACKLNR_013833 [Fusarium oxysporum f. sp. zingiberi]